MKASRWNGSQTRRVASEGPDTTDLVAYTMLSVGTLSWGLLGFIPIDLTYQPFGSIMVYSRTMCLLAALAAFCLLTLKVALRPIPVGVRRRLGPA